MTLYIRTQASSVIGMGHFMRCFALAETAREVGVEVTFVMDAAGETIRARCDSIGASVVCVDATVASDRDVMALSGLGMTRDDWLVIDSYAADADYITLLGRAARVAVIDDLALLERYDGDLIINPAMAAPTMGYERRTHGRCLFGAAYALIRSEFRRSDPPATDDHTVSLMFGGADPTGLTATYVLALLEAVPDMKVQVIAGPANTHKSSLLEMSERIQNMRLIVNPPSVAEVLRPSSLVVTAAGGSVGEVAAMGLPALVLVVYDNQMAALSACPFPVLDARRGVPAGLKDEVRRLLKDAQGRAILADHAHALVDGLGPRRIVEAMGYV